MLGISSVSNGNGVHPHEDSHAEGVAGTAPGTTREKTTAVYDKNRDSHSLPAQILTESEEDERKYYIAKFMKEYGLSEEVARAQYEFLH